MPEHIRALIAIIAIAAIVFSFSRKPACELIRYQDFTRRRNLWFGITVVAFLAQNFWLYVLISGLMLIHASRRETNIVAFFFFVLFAVPLARVPIPGLGLVNYLFDLSHQRLLALVVLLPAYLVLIGRKNTLPFGKMPADKLLIGYLILVVALHLRQPSVTDMLRQFLYQFIDVFLPYYVISRSLRNIKIFREALLGFVIAAMILAAIGIFESLRHWLLYSSLIDTLDLGGAMTGYLGREGFIRAIATTGQPIALGYVMAVAFGLYLFLQQSITSKFSRRMGFFLLCAGLLAPLSRGPWVGTVGIILVFIATGNRSAKQLTTLFLAGAIAMPLIAIMPGGEKIINLIPFIGETETENIDYRSRLFETSMVVIKRHPWFGSIDFRETPELESMRQGQGIIDIVNTYIAVALETGFIGVGLFIGFFLTIWWGIFRELRRLPDKNSEEQLLGRALLATLTGILIIIATVSSITIIPIVYWSVAGLGVAYIIMMRQLRNSRNTSDIHLT